MKRNDKDEASIRRYLLGYTSGEERTQLEEHFVTDAEYREQVLVIESELIEDYLANALSDEERERFVTHFLSTPQQIQKLKVAEALNRYFAAEAAAQAARSPRESRPPSGARPGRARFLPQLNRPAAFALTAAVLVVAVGAWLLVKSLRGTGEARNQEFQSELARLNPPRDPGNGPPSTPFTLTPETLVLSPLALRGGGELPTLTLSAGADVAQLLLVLPPSSEYKSYHTVLQKSGDPVRFTLNDLEARATESGKAVVLKLPTRYLSRGDYTLELSGSNAEGRSEPAGSYTFRVQN